MLCVCSTLKTNYFFIQNFQMSQTETILVQLITRHQRTPISPQVRNLIQHLVATKQVTLAFPGNFSVQSVSRGGTAVVCPVMPADTPCFVLFVSDNCIHCGPAVLASIEHIGNHLLTIVNISIDRDLLSKIPNVTHFPVTVTPTMQLFVNGEARVLKLEHDSFGSFMQTAVSALSKEMHSLGVFRNKTVDHGEYMGTANAMPQNTAKDPPKAADEPKNGPIPIQGGYGQHSLSGSYIQDYWVSDTAQQHARDIRR